MEFSSVQNLSLHLISSAFQRCRLSEQICRLSVILSRSSSSSLRVSISDTGNGSCLEEFQGLRFSSNDDADNWDGMLSIKTTSKFNVLLMISFASISLNICIHVKRKLGTIAIFLSASLFKCS
ncbi:hypothetical protein HN51_069286 [Arachis hypogaea]